MNATILKAWTPTFLASGIIFTIAFFPARAVGDAIASAGTITNKNDSDESGNLNTATESVCPKGWTLPSKKQVDNNGITTNFNSVLGGYYDNTALANKAMYGFWWSSETDGSVNRYRLTYNGNSLYTGSLGLRYYGLYIRCVSEEKTVTDLTYLQDMTGEIVDKRCRIFYLS